MDKRFGLELSRQKFVENVSAAGGCDLLTGWVAPGLLSSCIRSSTGDADSIYCGGPIVTTTKDTHCEEELAVKGRKFISAELKKDIYSLPIWIHFQKDLFPYYHYTNN